MTEAQEWAERVRRRNAIEMANSWGANWGRDGSACIPVKTFEEQLVCGATLPGVFQDPKQTKALSEKSSEKSPECLDTADGGMIQYAPMKEKGDMA